MTIESSLNYRKYLRFSGNAPSTLSYRTDIIASNSDAVYALNFDPGPGSTTPLI
jgi:hypothetical protein